MAQIVDGLDLALSLPWSCSPRSKAKSRPRHAAKARHLAMLLQRRKHVKQGVPRAMLVRNPTGPVRNPADGPKGYAFRGTRRSGGRTIAERVSAPEA
jgi:hypothetical protein